MTKSRLARAGVLRFYGCQCLVILGVATLLAVTQRYLQAYSVLLGGACSIAPSFYFASWVFKESGARAAQKIVNHLYLGEFFKIVITMLLFSLVFIFIKVSAGAFFGAFILAQSFNWLAPMWIKGSQG